MGIAAMPASSTRAVAILALSFALNGCGAYRSAFEPPPPYNLLPVDEMMSCQAISASFMFAAKRAARIEYEMSEAYTITYGYDRFQRDAPEELVRERRRLDALTDLQRFKGCTVLEPQTAVINERAKLEGWEKRLGPPVVLRSRG